MEGEKSTAYVSALFSPTILSLFCLHYLSRSAGLTEAMRFASGFSRLHLQVVLCFSPVGATLRVRARKFPSLVNCTAINWFHEWPQEALRSVSQRFLAEVESLPVRAHFYAGFVAGKLWSFGHILP